MDKTKLFIFKTNLNFIVSNQVDHLSFACTLCFKLIIENYFNINYIKLSVSS